MALAIPDEQVSIPTIGVVVPGATGDTDAREDVEGTVPFVIPGCPATTSTPRRRKVDDLGDLVAGVDRADRQTRLAAVRFENVKPEPPQNRDAVLLPPLKSRQVNGPSSGYS